MKRQRQKSIWLAPLAVFSVLTSFVFIYYGLGVLTAEYAPEWTKIFAYGAAGYGVGNIYILSWAWRTGREWAVWANKLIALCFFGLFIMNKWRTGVDSGLEYVSVLGMAVILWLNWFAVKKIIHRSK